MKRIVFSLLVILLLVGCARAPVVVENAPSLNDDLYLFAYVSPAWENDVVGQFTSPVELSIGDSLLAVAIDPAGNIRHLLIVVYKDKEFPEAYGMFEVRLVRFDPPDAEYEIVGEFAGRLFLYQPEMGCWIFAQYDNQSFNGDHPLECVVDPPTFDPSTLGTSP